MKASHPGQTAESIGGMAAPAAGGDAIVLTHTIPEEERA